MGRKNNKNSKRKKKEHQHSSRAIQGTLDITRSGVGFVIIEKTAGFVDKPPGSANKTKGFADKEEQDILVRPADFNTALHGDTVRVEIISDGKKSNRQRGVVMEVVERKQTDFIGHLEISEGFAF